MYIHTARDGFRHSSVMHSYVTAVQSSAASPCPAGNHKVKLSASALVNPVPCSDGATLHGRMVLTPSREGAGRKGEWPNVRRQPDRTWASGSQLFENS